MTPSSFQNQQDHIGYHYHNDRREDDEDDEQQEEVHGGMEPVQEPSFGFIGKITNRSFASQRGAGTPGTSSSPPSIATPTPSGSSNDSMFFGRQYQQRFPFILHGMLQDADVEGFDHIVSWVPVQMDPTMTDDRTTTISSPATATIPPTTTTTTTNNHNVLIKDGFKIHKIQDFKDTIMPKYFQNQTKYKSFLRQLNFYGFARVNSHDGNQTRHSRGVFTHPYLVRNHVEYCQMIERNDTAKSLTTKVAQQKTTPTATPPPPQAPPQQPSPQMSFQERLATSPPATTTSPPFGYGDVFPPEFEPTPIGFMSYTTTSTTNTNNVSVAGFASSYDRMHHNNKYSMLTHQHYQTQTYQQQVPLTEEITKVIPNELQDDIIDLFHKSSSSYHV